MTPLLSLCIYAFMCINSSFKVAIRDILLSASRKRYNFLLINPKAICAELFGLTEYVWSTAEPMRNQNAFLTHAIEFK